MSITHTVASRDQRQHSGIGQPVTSCHCGQQLDVCGRAHCPRCGRTLRRR